MTNTATASRPNEREESGAGPKAATNDVPSIMIKFRLMSTSNMLWEMKKVSKSSHVSYNFVIPFEDVHNKIRLVLYCGDQHDRGPDMNYVIIADISHHA